jgi:hypothetical protein
MKKKDTVRPRYHSDNTMSSGKKSASNQPVASDDDRKKGLRQATMAKDKTSDTLSLVIPAAGGKTTATPPASITPAAANGDISPPPPSPDSLTLQPPVVAHRGEGITDPYLQATFNDSVHLTISPDSWEEMQRQEEERKSRHSTPSDSSPSSKVEPGCTNTPKKKHSKKQKKMPEDLDLASLDDSSSSTIVEKTG